MAFASCAHYEHGYFTAYRRLAEDRPGPGPAPGRLHVRVQAARTDPRRQRPRPRGPGDRDLANYRQRHAQYKTDPDLQAAHAVAPWLVVWDDHEVDNNWADEIAGERRRAARLPGPPRGGVPGVLREHAAAAPRCPRGSDMQLYRRSGGASWRTSTCSTPGSTATTRLRRRLQGLPGRRRPGASLHRRRAGDMAGSTGSQLARPTLGHPRPAGVLRPARRTATPDNRCSMDAWDGYPASRARITRAGSTRRCATRSCSPATCTRTGPRTCSPTYSTTRLPRRRLRVRLLLDHHRW